MNSRVRICAAAFVLVLRLMCTSCSPADPAASSTDSVYARIDNHVQQRMRSDRIPGLAVGIVKGSETVYLKGFGIADPSGRVVTPETPFVLASVSKSITALAVMQLVEAGRVNLDDPVTKYVPGFAAVDKEASGMITVRQLLNQTSGLSTATGNLLNIGNGGKPLDTIVEQLTHARLVSQPGAAFHYSNANYVLLADIVEHMAGQTYGDYVQSHIFKPLDMASSSASGTGGLQDSMATGFRRWFGFPVPMQPYRYVECLNNVSTAKDMTNYLSAVMNGGSFRDGFICTVSTLEQMQKPEAQMGAGLSYAMGFEVDSRKPHTLVMHPGDTVGFNANIAILPQGNWGIIENRLHGTSMPWTLSPAP